MASLAFTLLCTGTEAFCRFVLHWGDPYDSPTLRTPLSFVDFHDFFPKFHYFHSAAFFNPAVGILPYPAPALVAYKLFLIPSPTQFHGAGAIARFEGSLLLLSWVFLALLYRWLARSGLAAGSAIVFLAGLYLLSFPFWFEFIQGNIEWIVWLFLTTGIWAFVQGHWKTAAVCMGVAASMKIFPVIFLGLFLPLRRFKEIGLLLLTVAVTTVASLWLVCPDLGLSAHETLKALGLFEQDYITQIRPVETGFDHSLFAVVKFAFRAMAATAHLQPRTGVYLAVVALGGCTLYVLRIWRMPLANQVLCLTVAAILLPPVSYDYTLLHLYAPLVLLVGIVLVCARRRVPLPAGLFATLLVFSLLLAPQQQWIAHGLRIAGQIKCGALLLLGYLALRYPFAVPQGEQVTAEAWSTRRSATLHLQADGRSA